MSCLVKINVDKVTKFSDSILFFFFVVPFGYTAGRLTVTQGVPLPQYPCAPLPCSTQRLYLTFVDKHNDNVWINLPWHQNNVINLGNEFGKALPSEVTVDS